jgi:pimeloyl-ACP methyl ester carboxylesterase
MAQEPVHIALVHGTWARKSTWTAADSPFRCGLERGLPQRVHFHTPSWSGRNWDRDRDAAARELATELRDLWQDAPRGRRFLVCHSHGGNIGIRAAVELQDILSGVICLNTPFISIMRQNVVWRLATFSLVLIVTPLALAASLDTIIPNLRLWHQALLLAAGVMMFALAGGFLSLVNQRLKGMSENVVKRLTPASITRCPVLCVSSAGDEATYGLGLLEVLANLPAFLQHVFILPVLLAIAVLVQVLGWVSPVHIGTLEFGLFASAWVIVLEAFVGLQILGLVSSLLLRALPLGLGFGVREVLANLAVRVAVTPVPLNARIVDFVGVDTTGPSLLAHSRIYDDPAVINLVTRWIANDGQRNRNERVMDGR